MPAQPPPQSLHTPQTVGQTTAPAGGFPQPASSTGNRSSTGNFGQMGGLMGSGVLQEGPPDAPRSLQQPHARSFSQGNMLGHQSAAQQQFPSRNSTQTPLKYGNGSTMSSQGPPQLGALPFQGSQPPGRQASPVQSASPSQGPPDGRASAGSFGAGALPAYGATATAAPAQSVQPSSKPVFGVQLGRLYERDGLAVPMVVYQCIQAVDLFGLGLEGIYRQSGSLTHINKLKGMFDTGMPSAPRHEPLAPAGLTRRIGRIVEPFARLSKPGKLLPRRQQRHRPVEAVSPRPSGPAAHVGAPRRLYRRGQ